jgi:hypothetical protein
MDPPEHPGQAASTQETAMYTHPDIAATLDHDRHRDMRADIGQHRRARQLRDLATAARRAQAAPRRAWRPVLWLRARAHA